MITIKKYANRRLYDTSTSAYVNLEDIAARIRDGAQVRVVDARTEEDLTRPTLVQILLETPGALEPLPPALLQRIIRSVGLLEAGEAAPLVALARQQLAAGLELLESQLAAVEAQLGWGPKAAPPPRGPGPDAAERAPRTPSADPNPDDVELDDLRTRLAALEQRLRGG